MRLVDFFHIKYLLSLRKKSEQKRADAFDKEHCYKVTLEGKSNEKDNKKDK